MSNHHDRGRIATTGAAVLTAVASSACCWLPLSLLAFGVSAGGISAWFEHYRLLFLIITGLFLGAAFYLVYARAPKCEPGSACATRDKRSAKLSKIALWTSTVVVVAFAAFPKYVGSLLPAAPAAVVPEEGVVTRTFAIGGMTCEACAVTLRTELMETPGVIGVEVSYEQKEATISAASSTTLDTKLIAKTVERLGYTLDNR